jgi:hypothetical protein
MDGTASLANREIGRVLPAIHRKVPFSGAVEHLNEAATARYFGDLSRDFIETGTSLTERTGFEDYGFCQIRVRTRPPTPKLRIRNPPKGPVGPKASVYTEVVPAKTI